MIKNLTDGSDAKHTALPSKQRLGSSRFSPERLRNKNLMAGLLTCFTGQPPSRFGSGIEVPALGNLQLRG